MFGTFIIDDPLGMSYLQNLYAPDPDPNMTITEYERSWQDNEEFGLNDMKTEGYEQDADSASAPKGADDASAARKSDGEAASSDA